MSEVIGGVEEGGWLMWWVRSGAGSYQPGVMLKLSTINIQILRGEMVQKKRWTWKLQGSVGMLNMFCTIFGPTSCWIHEELGGDTSLSFLRHLKEQYAELPHCGGFGRVFFTWQILWRSRHEGSYNTEMDRGRQRARKEEEQLHQNSRDQRRNEDKWRSSPE